MGPPNEPGRARGRSGGLHCTLGQYGYVPLGRHLVCHKSSAVLRFRGPSFIFHGIFMEDFPWNFTWVKT